MQDLLISALRGAYIPGGIPKLKCRTFRSKGVIHLPICYSCYFLVLYSVLPTI